MTSCNATSGGWVAGGTITNQSPDDREYHITILFTTDRATVIGVGTATITVATGQEREWSASAELAPASPTLCVLSGVG